MVYYNENNTKKAAWLQNLIAADVIAPGVIDTRSIEDVKPNELTDYTQCHFFAGIGVWSYALRGAGWPDDQPVWTGSCPCQPFSASGKRAGFADERHLWPAWFHLIQQRQPNVVFGEQVASKDGLAWLELVQADLEAAGYACGPVDTCAAGVGAPHLRQRLWLVADAACKGFDGERLQLLEGRQNADRTQASWGSKASGMGNTLRTGLEIRPEQENGRGAIRNEGQAAAAPGAVNGFWSDAEWIYCQDGKHRPIEPGTFPLAHGASARVLRTSAYGDAIVAPAAIEFIQAYRGLYG